jgi:hypothetical protein
MNRDFPNSRDSMSPRPFPTRGSFQTPSRLVVPLADASGWG